VARQSFAGNENIIAVAGNDFPEPLDRPATMIAVGLART
jgi:hypothetical protein